MSEPTYHITPIGTIHCYMSKPKAPGYRQKRDWLQARFAEGLRIKMLHETGDSQTGARPGGSRPGTTRRNSAWCCASLSIARSV